MGWREGRISEPMPPNFFSPGDNFNNGKKADLLFMQCCGSWPSGSGIILYESPDPSIIKQKKLEKPWFTYAILWLLFVKAHTKVISKKTLKKTYFLLVSWKPIAEKAGSGSAQWYGSGDPYPYQNVTDPPHCFLYCYAMPALSRGRKCGATDGFPYECCCIQAPGHSTANQASAPR